MVSLGRLWQHLITPPLVLRSRFDSKLQQQVADAVTESEAQHGAQIVVAVESSFPAIRLLGNETPRDRAIEVFSNLHVWDTELNSGLLLYLLFAEHDFEIVADRGFAKAGIGDADWKVLSDGFEDRLRSEGFAALPGLVRELTPLCKNAFPELRDEAISNRPRLL